MQNDRLTNPWIVFFVTALAVGMSTIDGGVVNVALPTLAKTFGVKIASIQWIVTSYLLMICTLLPICGNLGDLYTKKRIYIIGFLIFTLGSFLCGLSFSLHTLVAFRFLQGIGAAMLIANNQAIIMSNFPKAKLGRALGFNSMIVAIGSIAGPGIGGLIVGFIGWRWIFFVNIPLGILGCYLGYKILPKDFPKAETKFDYLGASIFALMMIFFVTLISNGTSWGWGSQKTFDAFLVVIFSAIIFFFREKSTKHPMLDLSLFKNKSFTSGNIVSLFIFMAISSNMILMPFFLDKQLHLAPQTIGLVLFVAPSFIFFAAPLSGFLTDKFNPATLISYGAGIVFLGLFAQSFVTGTSHLYRILIDQALIGMGCGFLGTPNNYSMLQNIPKDKLGVATGITSLMRNVGKICGITSATTLFVIFQQRLFSSTTNIHADTIAFTLGFRDALLTAAFFALAALIISLGRRHLSDLINEKN